MHSCQDDGSVQHVVVRFLDEFSEHKRFLEYFRTTWLANNKICKFFEVDFYDYILRCHNFSYYFISNVYFFLDL